MQKMGRKNAALIEKLKEVGENIFHDLVIDNFDEAGLKQHFGKENREDGNFMEAEAETVLKILNGDSSFLKKLINVNNRYVEEGYTGLTRESYLKEFAKEKARRTRGHGINPEQMILYILSTEKMQDMLSFFEKEYAGYLEKLEKNRKKLTESNPLMKEILNGEDECEDFEKEIFGHIKDGYRNVKKRNLEKLEKKYGLKFIKDRRTFEIPDKFVMFLDEKIAEILKMEKRFRAGFELLNISSQKFSEDEADFGTIMKDFERVEQENIFLTAEYGKLEEKNLKLREEIRKHRSKEKERIIERQEKEIENLKARIEKLEKDIENAEADSRIEITENLKIRDSDDNTAIPELRNKNVKIVGGKWTAQSIERAKKYATEEEFEIEFIQADEIFRKSDKLKKSDAIIFDVSYNSHSAYYRLKSFGIKIFRISTSNLEHIRKLNNRQ